MHIPGYFGAESVPVATSEQRAEGRGAQRLSILAAWVSVLAEAQLSLANKLCWVSIQATLRELK